MLETSKDLLNIVIAFCVLLVTVFLVWIMYYFAVMLKQVKDIVSEFRKKIELIGEIINLIKDKVVTSTTVITAVSRGLGDLISLFKRRKERAEESWSEKNDKKNRKEKK